MHAQPLLPLLLLLSATTLAIPFPPRQSVECLTSALNKHASPTKPDVAQPPHAGWQPNPFTDVPGPVMHDLESVQVAAAPRPTKGVQGTDAKRDDDAGAPAVGKPPTKTSPTDSFSCSSEN